MYKLEIIVGPEHLDELDHVNNVVYVQWVQDAAETHWNAASTPEMRAQCRWVVLRHEIDYKVPAVLHDVLVATTWVDPHQGAVQKRHVEITRAGTRIALACTTWCLLDPLTNRPKRISPEIAECVRPEQG